VEEDAGKSQRKERESLDSRLASAAHGRLQELEAAKTARAAAEAAAPSEPVDFGAVIEQNVNPGEIHIDALHPVLLLFMSSTRAENAFDPKFVKELGLLKAAVLGCVRDEEARFVCSLRCMFAKPGVRPCSICVLCTTSC
jgi:hypothetical protein